MSENQTVGLRYHQNRVNDLLKANNRYLERAREAERDYRNLTKEMKTCQADARELANKLADELLPNAPEDMKSQAATILSQRIYDFVQDFL